ncbi:MAG: hypothetical protein AAFX94_12195, partial [Myxococcota bacterium]
MGHAVNAIGAVDPERVQGRVSLLDDPLVRGQVTRISDGAFACLMRIQSINFSALERSSNHQNARMLWTEVSPQISSMWLAVEELEATLAPLIAEHEAKQGGGEDDFDFDLGESDHDSDTVEHETGRPGGLADTLEGGEGFRRLNG